MQPTDPRPSGRDRSPSSIQVRRPSFDFTSLPRRWIGDSAPATDWGNSAHVFIPLGEQFFIDTVRLFRQDITDPVLAGEVAAFIGQEAVHKRAHEALWETLRAHDVPVDDYAGVIQALRRLEPHLPARFRLSVTAALEHYTAAFGHAFITEDIAAAVPEEMARLLAWHGLEELEHRSVAFDVFETAGGRYPIRVAGFAFATALLTVVPTIGTVMFARARHAAGEPEDGPTAGVDGRELGAMSRRLLARMAGHAVDYLRPSYHPSQMEAV